LHQAELTAVRAFVLVKPPLNGGFFVLYSQQVLAVLVRDRHCAIAHDRAFVRRAGLRRQVAGVVYAFAKAVTIVAVVLDDDPVYPVGERAR